jgi:phage terminase small subunit
MRKNKLTDKRQRFVDEYLIDLNATQACIRAGYSKKNADKIGPGLLGDIRISEAIKKALDNRSERTEITQDRVLLEIARLAFNDPRRAFDSGGKLLPIQSWPDDVAAAISSIKVTEEKGADGAVISQVKEVKFWDKGKQLDLAGKHLGLFLEKIQHSGNVQFLLDKHDQSS